MSVMIDEKTIVRDVVVKHPKTRSLFERFGIDYCCGGAHDLKTAATKQGVDINLLLSELKEAIRLPASGEPEAEKDWSVVSLTELADHIEEKHHTFMREQLPRLEALIMKTSQAHKKRHEEMLSALETIFKELKREIESHLMKEEQILFPYIRQIEAFVEAKGPQPVVHCGSIQNPVRQMEHEHDNAGAALEKMRETTSDYSLPGDACLTFRALYDGLQALEKDLHEHIHLENNILFPKVVEIERASCV